jgi:hypothetical protein
LNTNGRLTAGLQRVIDLASGPPYGRAWLRWSGNAAGRVPLSEAWSWREDVGFLLEIERRLEFSLKNEGWNGNVILTRFSPVT